ncbi:MAG: histidine--tRNA ligase [Patescibacteria group bacterium]|nr:histidine--tRNA ligase [Patescibacteria group bacterium]
MADTQNTPEKHDKLSTEPYKGVRDFYPEDMAIQKRIFSIWRDTAEKYGYEEYSASVLEPSALYRAKSGEELVNEQTYNFTDRGEREVTLRPEMTPTVARMIAARRRDIMMPARWYSIPNLFRYEQPQRGRLREHWQLNVDIFGVTSLNAEIEIINIAYDIMIAYGLKNTDFEIRLNNRKLVNHINKDVFALDQDAAHKLSKILDKKAKINEETFVSSVKEIFAERSEDAKKFLALINSNNIEEFISHLPQCSANHESVREVREVMAGLERLGITNVSFAQTLMRGLDYYTGIVFEIFDLNPENRRSVFGGGRYDDLLSIFGNEKLPAVGFGAGDVIARDLLETYSGLNDTKNTSADVAICPINENNTPYALDIAEKLRDSGVRTVIDFSNKKIGDKIANANRRNIARVICIGDEEVANGKLTIKVLSSGEETITNESDLLSHFKE